jgi:1-deoxy-D-xylulose-5-phosphate synthase
MMFTASLEKHATFIRYPRGVAEGVPMKDQPKPLEIGKAEVLQHFSQNGGRKVALFPLGNMQRMAREVAGRLTSDGFDVAIVNPRFFKPIDAGTTEFFGNAAELVVTFEDHVLTGGYGSAVLELFSERGIATPVVRMGWPDQFVEHASTVDYLREKHGLTATNALHKIRTHFEAAEAAAPMRASATA